MKRPECLKRKGWGHIGGVWHALAFLAFAVLNSSQAQSAELDFTKDIRPLLQTYCFGCHGPEKQKAGINLDKFKDAGSIHREPKTWESVITQLRDREMPPEGKPQPKEDERIRLATWIEKTLENIDYSTIVKDPGRIVIHRLSRTEYNNTVRDLLGVTSQPADSFPSDGSGGGGFDNNADTLFVPPILLEKYMDAASKILKEADPKLIFVAKPGNSASSRREAAQKILDEFVPRAFRRPVEKPELSRYLAFFDESDKRGVTFEESIRSVLKAVLVSPNFLFRIEPDQPSAEPYPIGQFELASRLSYFLWSSMPDEELFKLARKKKLRDPKVLEEQIRRMLLDPKSRALADNFATQWLGVRNLKSGTAPDPGKFPQYTETLRDAMYEEVVQFFHHILRDNASVLNLLDSDYGFLNETLAKHYGIQGVTGPDHRRVAFNNPARGGVLGMGAVLTLTSYPQRTSPVLRGKWVLEELLGKPSPPPPANVGLLPPDDKPKDGLTFRQRLEDHRKKPECAACHKRMDPLGFGLENFDPIGRWRTELAGKPVDASGTLVNGKKFNGPVELKQQLMGQKDEFTRNLAERMLAYALGRGLEYYDTPTVKALTAATIKEDYRSQTMIREIVNSFPFQYRRNAPVTQEQKKETSQAETKKAVPAAKPEPEAKAGQAAKASEGKKK
ncbi:MAG TPA: DUF1592 domain-containing protein [Planctomycetota bacterium]|nr:DUF1592 domain-containing protein [Planctomycetota bacterium]